MLSAIAAMMQHPLEAWDLLFPALLLLESTSSWWMDSAPLKWVHSFYLRGSTAIASPLATVYFVVMTRAGVTVFLPPQGLKEIVAPVRFAVMVAVLPLVEAARPTVMGRCAALMDAVGNVVTVPLTSCASETQANARPFKNATILNLFVPSVAEARIVLLIARVASLMIQSLIWL